MNEKILKIIFDAINDYNELGAGKPIEAKIDTIVFGKGSDLDSLTFVSFIMCLEEKVFDDLEKEITVIDERAFIKDYNPFETVGSLSVYIQELISEV